MGQKQLKNVHSIDLPQTELISYLFRVHLYPKDVSRINILGSSFIDMIL